MPESLIESLGGPNGIWWLAGGYFSMVLAERVYVAVRGVRYDDRDALCSVGLNLISSVLNLIFAGILPFAAYVFLYDNARLFTLNSLWMAIPLAFLINELAYYAEHRISHRVGIFWAFHTIHHSSNAFNHTTAARAFFLDGQLKGLFGLTAALVGIGPVVYLAVAAVKNLFGIWNHASYVGHLGWMERVFATPRIHKVHHANQPKYIDKNYSQVLTIWDRMFGSFEPYDEAEPPVVGLVSPVYDNNPLMAQFVGFKQLWARMKTAERWPDRLAYLWRPPEWSHDGVCRSDCPKYSQAMVPAE